jgi:TonB family protein
MHIKKNSLPYTFFFTCALLLGLGNSTYVFSNVLDELKLKPRNLRVVEPAFPKGALKDKIEGRVDIEFSYDIDGRPKNYKIINSEPTKEFGEAVDQVFPQWAYFPDFNNLCSSLMGRTTQTIYFIFEDGKPEIKISRPKDILGSESIALDLPANSLSAPIKSSPEIKLRWKNKPKIVYPEQERRNGQLGLVVVGFSVEEDGRASKFETIYSIPSKSFSTLVGDNIKDAVFENVDGTPLGKKIKTCGEFLFQLE